MGVSTNGQICYGVLIDEDFEFPWPLHEEKEWWREVNGFRHTFSWEQVKCYADETGSRERIEAYFQEERDFDRLRPLPFTVVNVCSRECPIYVLAVPSTVMVATRGNPAKIYPHTWSVSYDEQKDFLEFCQDYSIPIPTEGLDWYLSSFWG